MGIMSLFNRFRGLVRELRTANSANVTITSTQPESTLREMLSLDSNLSGLEVVSPALEDAFLALTQESR